MKKILYTIAAVIRAIICGFMGFAMSMVVLFVIYGITGIIGVDVADQVWWIPVVGTAVCVVYSLLYPTTKKN